MKEVMNMTIKELIDDGAEIDIYFHDLESSVEATEKMNPFEEIGTVEVKVNANMEWLRVNSDELKMTVAAFYDREEQSETEEAQANLTQWERGHKDAGVKETDFR